MVPNSELKAMRQNLTTFDAWNEYLTLLAVSSINWEGLPPTVDPIYLERELFYHGKVIFFIADGALVALSGFGTSQPNLYGIPLKRTVNAKNGFTCELDNTNSVICYNNTVRTCGSVMAVQYALRLAALDRIIDQNNKTQRRPFIIRSSKEAELSVKNAYANIDNDEDVIAVDEDFREHAIEVLNFNVPYTAPQIRQLQKDILNEYLLLNGIGSANTDKAERLITSEVAASNSGLTIFQQAKLKPRNLAADEINRRFGRYLETPLKASFERDMLDYVIKSGNPQNSANDVIYTQGGGGENNG